MPHADELVAAVLATVKDLELRGYTFDAADASFELLLRNAVSGTTLAYFDVESWRVITDARGDDLATSEATVKLVAGGRRFVATGRATARSTPSTRRCARRSPRSTRRSTSSSSSTSGCASSTRRTAPTR